MLLSAAGSKKGKKTKNKPLFSRSEERGYERSDV